MLKKRNMIAATLSILLTMTACQMSNEDQQGTENPNGGGSNTLYIGRGAHSIYKNEGQENPDQRTDTERSVFPFAFDRDMGMNRDYALQNGREPGTSMGQIPYGYSERSATDPVTVQNGYGGNMYIDRQVLADGIAQLVCGLQGVERASVIVTDKECIIGYSSPNGTEVEEHVQLTGQSVTPRWFDVYATDDIELVERIKEVNNSKSSRHQDDLLRDQVQAIIQQLGGTQTQQEGMRSNEMNESNEMNQN